uniref:Uncharacterized protein n=1 Tax=Rhizophora mucronata TaxID=61149 RepID=A0A2P2PKK1_RHIMU
MILNSELGSIDEWVMDHPSNDLACNHIQISAIMVPSECCLSFASTQIVAHIYEYQSRII